MSNLKSDKNTTISLISLSVLAVLAATVIAGCGGGGAAVTPPDNNGGAPAPGTANISGQLVEGSGGRITSTVGDSLSGVLVQLINIATGQLAGTDVTDISGKYEFKGVPAGQQYLLKVEFQSSQDLNGDGSADQVELALALNPTDQQVLSLLQQLGATDSDNDGQLDAIRFENELSDDKGLHEEHNSEHRLRDGQTVIDDNGNGSFSDDSPFDDSNGDGVMDDNGGSGGHGADDGVLETEVRGAVTALSVDRIFIGEVSFRLTDATRWLGRDNEQLTAAQFAVGNFVEVEGLADGNGGLTALKVKLEDGAGDDNGGNGGGDNGGTHENAATGAITSLSADRIFIGDVSFLLTADTLWLDISGNAITPDQFSVGLTVEVEGTSDGNGGWIASKVKLEDAGAGSGGDDNGGNSGGGDDNGGDDNGGHGSDG
jgi:hypothetical protein